MVGPLYVGGEAWVGNDYVGGVSIVPEPEPEIVYVVGGEAVRKREEVEPIAAWVREEDEILILIHDW